MGYLDMYTLLEKHADRISRGDADLKQDILSLSYTAFTSAFSRGYALSIGELVNNMQYRAGELRSEKRRHFGNRGHNGTKDVYSKVRYYNNDVKLINLNEGVVTEDILMDSFLKRTTPTADKVAFRIDFKNFLVNLQERDRLILIRRIEGYKVKEISKALGCTSSGISRRLKRIGREIAIYLDIPVEMANLYGIA
ncbi:MAG: sigma-70 family RNA polymerase sigma factor [Candidatus Marinimicrobia bacterium]|nr:sigma-70 family RNA polymerase sigma factor [Candidatus Neomarinimicrobiota bacterium]